ncbi:MAG: hypothetical protein HQL14_06100 [Candidatus Omnitrophica bacterium]|nr:hypothetical protein [Candidatus Omnitrophota bacterium]
MKAGYILIAAIAGIWATSLFFGYIKSVSKTFLNTPSVVDSSSTKTQVQDTIDDTKYKQKQMMDDIKQKIQDAHNH